ncbi:hypothetical protein BBK36DRAFT_1171658 [Trichoderma citrinoviride]|uniref:Uncharacterized protein n=1 Tax=Trichoderma citrinoviride TaxID=58853 RepID=A0A2T4B275_9HYPO|nr:hypothetical protein BBK36DRAFT_1171658 [Trichoderma citrinoviride]PTB63427.1 hypothetical protein BBK36DRAFT_1171658 [Trichoderma citrinoviride]
MAPSQPRTVPSCEDDLVLGHLLGYRYKEVVESGGVLLPGKLRHIEKLEGFLMRDVLFVSVDVARGRDFGSCFSAESFCIGISILDTRSLTKPIDTDTEAEAAIKSVQYVTNDFEFFNWAAKLFRCGGMWYVDPAQAATNIAWLTRDRNYVLVGSELQRDCELLNQLSFSSWKIAERACFKLDILRAAQYPLQLRHRPNLQYFLETFGIKCKRLSFPGNYAPLSMKAMLLLAVREWNMTDDPFTDADRRLERNLLTVATHRLPSARIAPPPVSTEMPPADATDEKDERDDGEEPWVLMPPV